MRFWKDEYIAFKTVTIISSNFEEKNLQKESILDLNRNFRGCKDKCHEYYAM